MRRGWRNESVRHSLAARGIRTNYLKRKIVRSSIKGINAPDLVARRRELLERARDERKSAKIAQSLKKTSSAEQRKVLEEIRKRHMAARFEAQDELKQLNKEIKEMKTDLEDLRNEEDAESPGQATQTLAELRQSELELEEELRESRMARQAEARENVQAMGFQDIALSGEPTKAIITTVSAGNTKAQRHASNPEARKRKVIISGKQGFTKEEQERRAEINKTREILTPLKLEEPSQEDQDEAIAMANELIAKDMAARKGGKK